MSPKRNAVTVAVCASVAILLASAAMAKSPSFDREFATAEEIKRWATKVIFGGSSTQVFAENEAEIVVVTGMPTSGMVTSQFVFFGRKHKSERYRLVANTGVICADAQAKKDERGIVISSGGKLLMIVSFEMVNPK